MSEPTRITVAAPREVLQQMCNYVAIAETNSPSETLDQLILHALVTFEEDKVSSVQEVANILKHVFGVDVPEHQIQESLDQLVTTGQVSKPMGTSYILTADARSRVKARIGRSTELQDKVKEQWLSEMTDRHPVLDRNKMWLSLQTYLAKAFLRHGIQVAVLLDPLIDLPREYNVSLSSLLAETVEAEFDTAQQELARRVISDFLASVGKNSERAQFIAECADGAANYFSLAVTPDVAEKFRQKLNPLLLFCDTNFLFGILDLHAHALVEVSNHLLEVIEEHKLPLDPKYHAATLRELQASISHYADLLRRHTWPQPVSRAAATSRYISGVELKYHQKNAESGVSLETFLRPYQHVDVLLEGRKISVFESSDERQEERAALESQYQEFLRQNGKEKGRALVVHDATVLDCVRALRSESKSTLEAGALFVTCDYTLYRFDSEQSRKERVPACVVLPNVLWQVLRPFIPSSQDFDRLFAETFAIPEFRTIGSGASKACSRMLGLLATYKDFPEETATKLLSNDLLINQLRTTENDREFQKKVESAIALENQALLEEHEAMAKQIDALKGDKERAGRRIRDKEVSAAAQVSKAKGQLQVKDTESKKLIASKQEAEDKVDQESKARSKAERSADRNANLAATGFAAALVVGFEMVTYLLPWKGLKDHPNSYGLQATVCIAIVSLMIGLFRPDKRKFWWVMVLLGSVFVAVALLGGPDIAGSPTPATP